MKLYILVTGSAFALMFSAHVARVAVEGWYVAASPVFIITTVGSLAVCVWAVYLYRQSLSYPVQPRS
jgi:hypothetical protein